MTKTKLTKREQEMLSFDASQYIYKYSCEPYTRQNINIPIMAIYGGTYVWNTKCFKRNRFRNYT